MLGFYVYQIFFKYVNGVYYWYILAIKCWNYILMFNNEGSKLININFMYESMVIDQDLEP